jgi:hypothetical protein
VSVSLEDALQKRDEEFARTQVEGIAYLNGTFVESFRAIEEPERKALLALDRRGRKPLPGSKYMCVGRPIMTDVRTGASIDRRIH